MNSDSRKWDIWCRRYGIDPNTPDERLLDDFLHGREPHSALKFHPKAFSLLFGSLDVPPPRMSLMPYVYIFDETSSQLETANWRDEHQRSTYEGWASYDAAVERMPLETKQLQARAEVVELERMFRL